MVDGGANGVKHRGISNGGGVAGGAFTEDFVGSGNEVQSPY